VTKNLASTLRSNRVIPVAQFDDRESALKTAELLSKHSFGILEITLRTESAIENIHSVAKEFPDFCVGAGSVLSMDALKKARDAGASFCVAPGMDPELIDYAATQDIAFVPGVATPTELNTALKKTSVIKLFPVSLLGGPEYIKALSAPFRTKDFHLVPTGGVNRDNYLDYLKQDRVIAVGMSYIVDSALIQKGDFASIEERMKMIASTLA
jgi:2-dehydro-3-deoxyphosphogluconate aldolase / (4S)-4-hydroxy-2-oxoglutarate aldolase